VDPLEEPLELLDLGAVRTVKDRVDVAVLLSYGDPPSFLPVLSFKATPASPANCAM